MQTDAEKEREGAEFDSYEEAKTQDLTSHELYVSNQIEPVDLTSSQNGGNCPEADQNENVTPEDFGVHEADKQADPDDGTVDDVVNDHRLTASKDVYGGRKTNMPDEVEITHLRHPTTGIVFPVNEVIIKQKHLIPCDEKGKTVYDNRVFSRFN